MEHRVCVPTTVGYFLGLCKITGLGPVGCEGLSTMGPSLVDETLFAAFVRGSTKLAHRAIPRTSDGSRLPGVKNLQHQQERLRFLGSTSESTNCLHVKLDRGKTPPES